MFKSRSNESARKQVILESGHSYREVRPEKKSDNALFFRNESGGKESNVDKRIEDKFVRISNVLKEDSAEVGGFEETPKDFFRTVMRSHEVTPVDIGIPDAPTNDLFSRGNDELGNSITIGDDATRYQNRAKLTGTHGRSTIDENFLATQEYAVQIDDHRLIATNPSTIIIQEDDFTVDYKKSASGKAEEKSSTTVVDPFLLSPITRVPQYHVSKDANPNESTSPTYANDSITKWTNLFTRESSSGTRHDSDVVDYQDFTGRSQESHENEEIAELVERIVRQYSGYTPIMPGMPTFPEITEAETLPSDDVDAQSTTITTVTTTLATTTKITDAAFRPSIRPSKYALLPPSEEIHDEVSLDESTFVDETEATTISQAITVSVIILRNFLTYAKKDRDNIRRFQAESSSGKTGRGFRVGGENAESVGRDEKERKTATQNQQSRCRFEHEDSGC